MSSWRGQDQITGERDEKGYRKFFVLGAACKSERYVMSTEELSEIGTITACVDGAEIGYRVADFAIALAKKTGSKVIFVNVVGVSTTETNYTITADLVGSFERMGTEALSRCGEKAKRYGVRFETFQLEGEPVDEILRSARQTRSDCIVIGRNGLGRLEKLLLGSVSEKIVKSSDVPVVVVK